MSKETKPEMMEEYKVLMYAGMLVDAAMLAEGIYQTKLPSIYGTDTTLESLIFTAKNMNDMMGNSFLPESYFKNIVKCELVKVTMVADLRSVIRGKLVEFKKWHNKECGLRGGTILESEIDNFLSNSPVSNGESGC